MHLTDTTWNLRCASIEEKGELLAYAAQKGISFNEVSADDLGLGYNSQQPGTLYVFPEKWATDLISAEQFRILVDALPLPRLVRYPALGATLRGASVLVEEVVVGFVQAGARPGSWLVQPLGGGARHGRLVQGTKAEAVATLLALCVAEQPSTEQPVVARLASPMPQLFFAAYEASQAARRSGMVRYAEVLLLNARYWRQAA